MKKIAKIIFLYLPGWCIGVELIIGRFGREYWFKLARWIPNFLVGFSFGISFGEWLVPSYLFLLNNARIRFKPYGWVENDAELAQNLFKISLMTPYFGLKEQPKVLRLYDIKLFRKTTVLYY